MSKISNNDALAKRAVLELALLSEYLDDHDGGRVPANAEIYQAASQKVKVLLAPNMANPHVQQLCHKSHALHQILGNILVEQEPGLASDLECALEDANVSAYWRH